MASDEQEPDETLAFNPNRHDQPAGAASDW